MVVRGVLHQEGGLRWLDGGIGVDFGRFGVLVIWVAFLLLHWLRICLVFVGS